MRLINGTNSDQRPLTPQEAEMLALFRLCPSKDKDFLIDFARLRDEMNRTNCLQSANNGLRLIKGGVL